MADETDLPPVEGAETADAQVEGAETTNDTPDPIEALASDMGWVPQDKFRGEPDEWKPADEFIKAGREINRSMARKLNNMEEQLTRVTSTSSQILADKIAERDAYWQNQHRQAVETGDHELAATAVGEMVKLKASPQANGASAEPPETQQFKQRHAAWFDKHGPATRLAMRVAEEARQMGATPAEQLEDAEEEVRRRYPDLFPTPAKRPAAVQTGSARNGGGGSRKKGFADMPAESQTMARDYLERHGVPLERTAANYWADIAAKSERKVG